MFTRINLIFGVGLLACTTASAQLGVDFRSAIKQTSPATVAVKLDNGPSPPSTRHFRWQFDRLPPNLPKELIPWTMSQAKQDSYPMRSGFAVAEDLVISCRVPQDEVEMVTGDGRVLQGRVVLRDHVTGLAAIRVEGASLTGLAVAAEAPEAGLPVLVSWLKGGKTLTSEASMIASEPNADQSRLGFTQSLDIDFTPEKIGAPIVDAGGKVVGVLVSTAGNHLCLATDHVARLTEAASAEEPKDLYRGRMGIQLDDQQGALIAGVMDEMPAMKAELAAGDKVTKVGDRECQTHLEVMAAVSMLRAGDEVKVEILRGDETLERTLELASAGPEPDPDHLSYAPKVSQQVYQLKDGKLVPLDEDAPVVELDIRSPRSLLFGNLKVERSELEQSLKKLEAEKRRQDELITKLQEKIAQMELQEKMTQTEVKAILKQAEGENIARLEGILEEIKKKLKSQNNQDSQDSQDGSSPR